LLSSSSRTDATPASPELGVTTMRNLLLLLSAALFSLTACEACEKDSPREELREDIQQVGENVDDAVDESRVGMN